MARYDNRVPDEIVSKTQRKKQMLELQALGERLVGLPEAQLAEMALEPQLEQAVLEARGVKTHEARRRQLQYIGRLMREVDATPIRERLAAISGTSARAGAAHRRLEALRDRLLADDEALTDFAARHPGADVQKIRSLIRQVRHDRDAGKPPRSYRELFRLLKDLESPGTLQG
ncbi:MAG TPA: ribosome biogenesis factor YjgA [Burkholderiales bacterium]|nr:ribosome biogenesis factor YjgA [Burkholderiales bacterium]